MYSFCKALFPVSNISFLSYTDLESTTDNDLMEKEKTDHCTLLKLFEVFQLFT